ncbi:MAG: aquaporin [Thermoanaerobaculia bacterium]|nr:aquaporin [Thermoanaerobaculia bacterium]
MQERGMSKALVVEFIGTFAFVFIGAGTVALGLGGLVGAAFAHGLVVLGLTYAYGHISGTHINPAVTIGVWMAGRIDAGRAISYIVFQVIGGVLAGFALRYVLGGAETGLGATMLAQGLEAGGTTITVPVAAGFFLEALLTFFLVNAVLFAGTDDSVAPLAGIAIGSTFVFCFLMGGPLTGASLNPARTLGPALASENFAHLWLYMVAPPVGAVAAAVLNRQVLSRR